MKTFDRSHVQQPGSTREGPPRGVISAPNDEAIERWLRVPPIERLRWLAEANEFLYLAQPPDVRKAWEAFRRENRDVGAASYVIGKGDEGQLVRYWHQSAGRDITDEHPASST